MAAPTALSLIAVTFPEGPPRNCALAAIRVTRQDLSGVDQTTAPAG